MEGYGISFFCFLKNLNHLFLNGLSFDHYEPKHFTDTWLSLKELRSIKLYHTTFNAQFLDIFLALKNLSFVSLWVPGLSVLVADLSKPECEASSA